MTAAHSVLVTGGNGFIGRHLVRRLLRDGCEVSLLQRSPDQIDPRAQILRVSRLGLDDMAAALASRRFDAVFHLAGYGIRPDERNPDIMFHVNVDVTRALVDIASSWPACAVVIAGSGSEYRLEGVDRPITEEHALECYKLYGASKAAGTLCATALAAARHIPFAACRIFGVYGPGEAPHRLLPCLMKGMHSNERIPLSSGRQQRDFLFVDDVIDALVRVAGALEREPRQFILNVGTGRPISVRDFARTAAATLDLAESRLGFGDIPLRPDDVMMFSGCPDKLHALTGWTATVGPSEGIQRCRDVEMAALKSA